MNGRALVLPLLAGLAAALVACGGEDSMSTSEYRAEAKRICTDAQKQTQAIEQPTRATPDAISDYFRRVLAANEKTTESFRKLDPPENLSDAHADALRVNDEAAKSVRGVVREIEGGGDPREVLTEAQSRLEQLSRESGDAAKRLGVPACADE
jgi:hypothetical protein